MGGWAEPKELFEFFQHKDVAVGLVPIINYFPVSQVFDTESMFESKQGDRFSLYTLGKELFTDILKQLPQVLNFNDALANLLIF